MTNSTYNLKIQPRLQNVRLLPRYPASISGGTGIVVANNSGALSVALDLLLFNTITNFNPLTQFVPLVDANGNYSLILSGNLLNPQTNIQVVTAAGDVNVAVGTGLLIMNRAVDASPSNIILPLASAKVGRLKIVDFKGNATAFPHTIKTTAPDTFQGALTQWLLDANGASVVVDPIPGTGYAV